MKHYTTIEYLLYPKKKKKKDFQGLWKFIAKQKKELEQTG